MATRYLSSRGGEYDQSFEQVVLKGLSTDGGLYIPESIPSLPSGWEQSWKDLSFQELSFEIFSLYISRGEISSESLRGIIKKSYATFRDSAITPTVPLQVNDNLYLLELFHGPTFAFKDVALQFLGNLFEFFLVRKNRDRPQRREHLTVVGATSGDTGSAAIYGLRGKKDVSVFIMYPTGKVSPVQEAQMTTVTDPNVHCLSVDGTFDDCQDFVKALFADEEMNKNHKLAAVNSINWARILAQITYYFASYFAIRRSAAKDAPIRFVVPTGNFGDILAGYFAKRMGLPIEKLVIATNENDILHRFWRSGAYEKKAAHGEEAQGGFAEDGVKAHEDGAKETLSPAMDILVSSNFERLLWFFAFEGLGVGSVESRRHTAGEKVRSWLGQLKSSGGFKVEPEILDLARESFESERVSDEETIQTIRNVYSWAGTLGQKGYILDPHTAVGVQASLRSMQRCQTSTHVALSTAHPAKFSKAVELALSHVKGFEFSDVLPEEFIGMEQLPRRLIHVNKADGLEGLRALVMKEVDMELANNP